MTSTQGMGIYKTKDQIVSDILAAWQVRVPDIAVDEDSVIRIITEVWANSGSGYFLALQLLHNDMFVQTMSTLALQRTGEEFGRPQKAGTLSIGSVLFSGDGGTFIAAGSQVGVPRPAVGDTLVFETTDDATIPSPGVPGAPTAADAAVSGNVTGTIEYAVTFTTAQGETAIGASSDPVVLAASQGSLTDVPLGGTGTVARKVYRSKNGGVFQFVATLADNTTTTYTDNVADGSLGGNPPSASTAERVVVAAQSAEAGVAYNVGVGAITTLVSVEGDVTGVTNTVAFTGGTDIEAVEVFREALLEWRQNPQSGSSADLVSWATSIDGVDSAAVFKNVNLAGSAELGSVVIRISGPSGSIPDGDKIDEVQAFIDSRDLANITIYVGAFTPLTVASHVEVEVLEGYVIGDVEDSVSSAIQNYINAVPPGGTVFVAGIYHAAFALPGVRTLTVLDPTDDVTAADDEKPVATADDITVDNEVWS